MMPPFPSSPLRFRTAGFPQYGSKAGQQGVAITRCAHRQGTDLLFGNAVFHWVPDHPNALARLLWSLPPGGVLAVQMPDNTNEPALMLMEKVAASGPWAAAISGPMWQRPAPGRRIITIC